MICQLGGDWVYMGILCGRLIMNIMQHNAAELVAGTALMSLQMWIDTVEDDELRAALAAMEKHYHDQLNIPHAVAGQCPTDAALAAQLCRCAWAVFVAGVAETGEAWPFSFDSALAVAVVYHAMAPFIGQGVPGAPPRHVAVNTLQNWHLLFRLNLGGQETEALLELFPDNPADTTDAA